MAYCKDYLVICTFLVKRGIFFIGTRERREILKKAPSVEFRLRKTEKKLYIRAFKTAVYKSYIITVPNFSLVVVDIRFLKLRVIGRAVYFLFIYIHE